MTAAAINDVVDIAHRRRNRNAVRDVAILPPAVDAKAAALGTFDAETQVRAVSVMLTHATTELAKVTAAQSFVEWKAKAGAIQELAKQLNLSKGLQLDAAEFVRRTERSLVLAIRAGQARGEIMTDREAARARSLAATAQREKNQGRSPKNYEFSGDTRPRVSDFLTGNERNGSGVSKSGSVYDMTDGISDDQFEEALAEARSEGNLSRANVARKAKSKAAPVDAPPEPAVSVPEPKRRRLTKHDSTEMLANISGMLNGIVETLPFFDPADIDAQANKSVIQNIRTSMNLIRTLMKEIENV